MAAYAREPARRSGEPSTLTDDTASSWSHTHPTSSRSNRVTPAHDRPTGLPPTGARSPTCRRRHRGVPSARCAAIRVGKTRLDVYPAVGVVHGVRARGGLIHCPVAIRHDVACVSVISGLGTKGGSQRTTERIHVTVTTGGTEVWRSRIGTGLAEQLREDSEILGLQGQRKQRFTCCTGARRRSGWHAAWTPSTVAQRHLCPQASRARRTRTTTSVTPPEPFRGEVWEVRFRDFGEPPGDHLWRQRAQRSAGPCRGASGDRGVRPAGTHVPLDLDAGLTKYDESYVDVTSLDRSGTRSCFVETVRQHE